MFVCFFVCEMAYSKIRTGYTMAGVSVCLFVFLFVRWRILR